MSAHYDEYEYLNDEADRFVNGGHSGKHRSKREVSEHQNRPDPSGHTRKIVTNMANQRQRQCSQSKS